MIKKQSTAIVEWDWVYKIGFDYQLCMIVEKSVQFIHDNDKKRIMYEKVNWAKNFISLDCLIESIEQSRELIRLENKDINKILHIPFILKDNFKLRIEKLSLTIPDNMTRLLLSFLESGISQPYHPVADNLFKNILSKSYYNLIEKSHKEEAYVRPSRQVFSYDEAKLFTQEFILKASSCRHLLKNSFDISKMNVIYTDNPSGFGEFWPVELQKDGVNDLLIIHLNYQSLDRDSLESTLYHEIYGHGLFYNKIRNINPHFIDHGAIILVEGWATACEWLLCSRDYSNWARYCRLNSLALIKETNASIILKQIEIDIKNNNTYSVDQEAIVTDFFQYPGYSASYGLGALWFEGKKCTLDLNLTLGDNWGDFFDTW